MFTLIALVITCIVSGVIAWRERKKQQEQRGIVVTTGLLMLIATIISIIAGVLSIAWTLYRFWDDHFWFWYGW